ncbi:MAG: response regulator transcription factor [Ilumatobacteraceae bacterium]
MRRVVIADDQDLVRAGLRVILETNGVEVVGEAADGAEAVRVTAEQHPDVVLMDVRMPVFDGIEATRRIRAGGDDAPRVLVVTTFDLDEYVFEALRAGASGFLLKDAPRAELLRGIEVVAAGDALLAPSATRRLVEDFARRRAAAPPPATDALGPLTPRERHVLELMARGLSNGEIAAQLVVGQATVKTHVGHILTKLDLRDRVQAVILAYEVGLVQPGDGPLPPQ